MSCQIFASAPVKRAVGNGSARAGGAKQVHRNFIASGQQSIVAPRAFKHIHKYITNLRHGASMSEGWAQYADELMRITMGRATLVQ